MHTDSRVLKVNLQMVVLATFVLFCIMYVQFSGPVTVRRDLNGEDVISISVLSWPDLFC